MGFRDLEQSGVEVERIAAEGFAVASAFLKRWDDPTTRAAVDDCAQEAVVAALQRLARMREPDRFPALVRTIARRMRWRELRWQERSPLVGHRGHDERAAELPFGEGLAKPSALEFVLVEGRVVDKQWVLAALDAVLDRMPSLCRSLLRGYYEGFSCRELAERYGIEEHNVKVRLHRGRKKVRRELEREVRQTKEE